MSAVVQTDKTAVDTKSPSVEKTAPDDLTALFAQVVDITQELFPGEVSAQLLDDPEYPQDRYMVFEAQFRGTAGVESSDVWNGTAALLDWVDRSPIYR